MKLTHVVIQLIRYINKPDFKVLAVLKLTVKACSHVPESLKVNLRCCLVCTRLERNKTLVYLITPTRYVIA